MRLRDSQGELERSPVNGYPYARDISAITPSDWMLWFYVPEAGQLATGTYDCGERVEHSFSESGNALIEAGVSLILEDEKVIRRSRLYVQSGYYDGSGVWIPRPKCVDAVYTFS